MNAYFKSALRLQNENMEIKVSALFTTMLTPRLDGQGSLWLKSTTMKEFGFAGNKHRANVEPCQNNSVYIE